MQDVKGNSIASKFAPYLAMFQIEAVAASTGYVLVDLSDTTNYPHSGTNAIILKSLALEAEKKTGGGGFDIWVGVINEVDATNGSTNWIHVWHLETDVDATDNTRYISKKVYFSDLDLEVDADTAASEALRYIVSNIGHDGDTTWQNDTGLASPIGASGQTYGKPGAGDLVVYVEETADSGTLDFCISAEYDTR